MKAIRPISILRTPLASLPFLALKAGMEGSVYAKLEFHLPTGSTKYRVAAAIAADAFERYPNATGLVDASSGGTGRALSREAVNRGKTATIFLPKAQEARRILVEAEGGRVVLVDGGMDDAQAAAAKFAAENPGVVYTNQFSNPLNVLVHAGQTAFEIFSQLPEQYTACWNLQASGTGGSLKGIGQGLTELGRPTRSICAIPVDENGEFSRLIPGVAHQASRFIDWEAVQSIKVPERLALQAAKALIRQGIYAGASSGLNFAAAFLLAQREPPPSDVAMVTTLPDRACLYQESHPQLFVA